MEFLALGLVELLQDETHIQIIRTLQHLHVVGAHDRAETSDLIQELHTVRVAHASPLLANHVLTKILALEVVHLHNHKTMSETNLYKSTVKNSCHRKV